MPVLSDEDVGLGSSYLTDEDVGLGEYDEYAGGETASPEELSDDEARADELIAMKAARKTGRFSENAATALGALGQVVEPFAVTPQNRLGPFGTAAKGLGHIAEYTGQVGKGAVQDLRLGNITGLPATSQALSTGRAPELEPTSLPARIIEGTGQGIGMMAPAIAATVVGVPPMAAYPTIMGSQAYQESGGDLKATAQAALLGAVLPAVSSVAKAATAKAIVGASRYVPRLAANPVLSKSVEEGASQIAQNAVAGIVEAPELIALYKEDPNKFYDRAAEMIGVNLAMGAHDIMGIANPNVRSQSGRELAQLIRPKMEEVFTPPERGGIPDPRLNQGEPNAIQEPGRKAQPATETPQAVVAAEAQAKPQEGNTPQDGGVLLDKSKWTKATDTENLKAATPEERTTAAQKPLDVDSFLKVGEDGHKAVDVEKLKAAVEGGHITSASPAVDALLLHMLKPSELHPLKSIRMLDLTPEQAQFLTGEPTAFHGRYSQKAGERTGLVEMVMKRQSGRPVTAAEFMETLTHELGHNTVTSKIREAPPEIKKDVDDLFSFVREKGKGTEWEKHNALSNAHELWAELADPKVHKWLSELDYSGDIRRVDVGVATIPAISPRNIRSSALGRFYEIAKKLLKLPDFITDAFGNKVETITALDQMVSLSSRLEKIKRSGRDAESNLSPAKDFKSAIKETEKVPNEELMANKGGATGFMWDLGAKAKTPEDVAALKAMAEESGAKAMALMKAGNYEEAMAVAGRQPAEAYEFATGVKLDGTPKWETFEKRRPGYVPPVPDAKYVEAKGGAAKVEPVAASGSSPGLGAGAATTPVATEPLKVTAPQQPSPTPSGAPVGKDVGQIPTVEGAKSQKWTSATEEAPAKPGETLGGQTYAGIPNPAAVYRGIKQAVKDFGPSVKAAGKVVSDATKAIYKENLSIRKMNDLDRSVLGWSAKMQRSLGEAWSAQKDIQAVAKKKVNDEALSNWMEAGGGRKSDNDVQNKLVWWRNQATDPKLKAGYEAALKLSPEEVAVAQEARKAYDQLFDRAERWGLVDKDPTKPSSFRDDYVTHIWDLGKGAFAGGSRTLKDQFKYAKARTFDTFFDGEQAGMKPKTKRLSQVLPVYLHEMNSVIAAKQLVKEMSKGKASDGRPLLASRGIAEAVSGPKGEAVLVRPEAPKGDTKDYKQLANQPALHDWVWAGKDTKGNPVFEKSDLILHPEAYKKLKAILGKSKIREWYESPGTATMEIPKAIAKGLDMYQSEAKRTMLGLISPFHQVQEGTHAIGHRVDPFFNVPKPNMENPVHLNLAKKGLMILPDRASERNFTEGLRPSGLVSFIPGVGRVADFYSNYLFHEYIPGLKIKTALAIIERNKKVYAKQLASGEVSLEDVELLSTTQANAAYGHLNYADLGRDPTIQHIMQLGLLAPDFLEARGRFAGQALKGIGPKVGREQLLALATLAVAQAALAYTSAKLTDGEWEGSHPFEFRKNNRRYTMRSVPEDLMRFAEDIKNIFTGRGGDIPFISNRVNPITAKLPYELTFGREMGGRKITRTEALKHGLTAPAPLTARGFMGIDKSSLEEWEQLAGAAGLKIMRYSPQNEVRKMLLDFKKASGNPKLVAQAEQAEAETFAPSSYSDLRQALEKGSLKDAAKAYEKLLEIHPPGLIKRAMNPVSIDASTGAERDKMLPKALEREFLGSLKDEDREVYEAAKRQRKVLFQRFQRMLSE